MMESLAEQTWDVVICGTGLQQSLLALALSRSGRQILHLDSNDYYGGNEAALTLQEAEDWVKKEQQREQDDLPPVITKAFVSKFDAPEGSTSSTLSSSRAYSLSLSPFIVHTRSSLLSQLVSSRAYRQLEFLAVGSFHVFDRNTGRDDGGNTKPPAITPIPSTREAIFNTTLIDRSGKRTLMKFITFALSFQEDETSRERWLPVAEEPFASFLGTFFKLPQQLRTLVLALTLSLDGEALTVRQGLTAVHRHLTSMNVFGPGFAAVYPKYGGGGEIAQVACRAGAVGGGVYMLGTGPGEMRELAKPQEDGARVEVTLSESDVKVKTRHVVREVDTVEETSEKGVRVSRLVAVVDAPLDQLFAPAVEDTPNPAVAVIAMPPGSVFDEHGSGSKYPIYVFAHSSETGECPAGQCILYFTVISTKSASSLLQNALEDLTAALDNSEGNEEGASRKPHAIYQLSYDHHHNHADASDTTGENGILSFSSFPPDQAISDSALEPVKKMWARIMGDDAQGEEAQSTFMKFEDREGMGDDDES